jgi:hypothetical protein
MAERTERRRQTVVDGAVDIGIDGFEHEGVGRDRPLSQERRGAAERLPDHGDLSTRQLFSHKGERRGCVGALFLTKSNFVTGALAMRAKVERGDGK